MDGDKQKWQTFHVGKRVRINPAYEEDKERGKYYLINAIENNMAYICWENYYHSEARPFWIEIEELINPQEQGD